jgi:NAD(P)-dependent dehydrogenase (short-subunit alcohol dehydrogenase family)
MQNEDPASTPDYLADLRLEGRGFVVLGAGPGIGAQTCHALSQAGGRVLCVDIDRGLAEKTAADTKGIAFQADVTRRDGMQGVFDEAHKHFGAQLWGVVDVVGIARIGPLVSFGDEDIESQFNLVLKHAMFALQIGGPMLAANGGGAMTFIGSISGLATLHNHSMYGTAKAALHQLVRYAAQEFGPSGVRVNAIAPGYTRTPRLLVSRTAAMWKTIDESNPLRRAGNASDVARTALFLSSDLARYVTGNVLVLDGGVSNATSIPRLTPAPDR